MENIIKQTFSQRHGQLCEESTISFTGLENWTAGLHQMPASTPEMIQQAEEISESLGIEHLEHDDHERWSVDLDWQHQGAYLAARVTRRDRDAAIFCTRNLIAAINRCQPLEGDWQGDIVECGHYLEANELGSIRVYGQMAEVGDVLFFSEHDYGVDEAMRSISYLLPDVQMDSSAY